MRGWTNDDRIMIACCNDGTRPVIFKIERIDYKAVHFAEEPTSYEKAQFITKILAAENVVDVTENKEGFLEVVVDGALEDSIIKDVAAEYNLEVTSID